MIVPSRSRKRARAEFSIFDLWFSISTDLKWARDLSGELFRKNASESCGVLAKTLFQDDGNNAHGQGETSEDHEGTKIGRKEQRLCVESHQLKSGAMVGRVNPPEPKCRDEKAALPNRSATRAESKDSNDDPQEGMVAFTCSQPSGDVRDSLIHCAGGDQWPRT